MKTLKEIKTIECVIEGAFFKVYKIEFTGAEGYIYLVTRLTIRNCYNAFKNIQVKRIVGNIFKVVK